MNAYIIDIVRSPVGKYGGKLASVRPDDLLAMVLKGLMARNASFPFNELEDIIIGAANQSGEDNRNVARMAGLLAGLPIGAGGVTVNRLCGSGLQAITDAYRAIAAGEGEVYIAGGVESMSRAPFVMGKSETPFSRNMEVFDTTMGWRFINPALSALHHPYTMGETAENVAVKYNISREAQDKFALQSQERWAAAQAAEKFANEIIPIPIFQKGKQVDILTIDEHPRATSMEALGKLKPAFKAEGSVTAGNSSGINDGAAACLIVSEAMVEKYNLKPMARIIGASVAGLDPSIMGVGPIAAVEKLLSRTGIRKEEIGLWELNEAFASQSLAVVQELHLNIDKVNVNGGSIAIGHPLGASGVRISATLLHEMQKQGVRYGVATMCIGVGQGIAVMFEQLRA